MLNLYKIIVRPDNSIADSIFVNCTNKNLFFHKKMYDGKLVNTGYMLNNKLHGVFTIYGNDGKTVLSKQEYENGELKK